MTVSACLQVYDCVKASFEEAAGTGPLLLNVTLFFPGRMLNTFHAPFIYFHRPLLVKDISRVLGSESLLLFVLYHVNTVSYFSRFASLPIAAVSESKRF
jgi:hypothetical protein